jgi:Tol biopolymer transport system component
VGNAGNAVIDIQSGTGLTVNLEAQFGSSSELILRGASVLAGSGGVFIDGQFSWQGGTLQGSGSFTIGGTATTGGNVFLDGGNLIIVGQLTIDGAPGTLTPIGSPLILVDVGGTLTLENGPDLFAAAATPTLENQGTLVVNGTDDEAIVDWPLNNLGTIDVASFVFDVRGLLTHQAGGLITVSDNAELISHGHSDIHGPVTVDALGTVTFTGGALDATHLFFPGSAVQSTGTVTVDAATLVQVNGAFETTTLNLQNSTLRFDGADTAFVGNLSYTGGGFLSGSGVLAIRNTATTLAGNIDGNGRLAILTGATATLQSPLRGWAIDVIGVFNWGDYDLSLLQDPVTLQQATLNVLAGGVMEIQHAALQRTLNGTAANLITNAGIIRKSAGTALTLFLPPVTNTGVIDVQTGTMQTRGLLHQAGATIFGNGTLDLGPGTTTLAGGFSPGASPGILTLLGVAPVYDPTASGVLDIEVNGLTAGTQYDRLAVTGAAVLNGTLNVTVNSFTPTTADTMVILTATTLTGTFATTNVPGTVALVYDTPRNRVLLVGTASAGVPPVIFSGEWVGDVSGVFRVDGDGANGAQITPEGPPGQPFVRARWSPDGTRATYSARSSALVENQLHVISALGVPPDHLTSLGDTSTWNPRYNPGGLRLAFECGNGDYPTTAQDVCVIPDVTGALGTLNGIGDGAGKVFVTDAVSPDLGGSGAFAWDPGNDDRLAVVRDSVLGGPVGSQIWFVDFDGGNPTPLGTQVVLDDTGFPVTIEWMDWSPDGTFIAFEGLSPNTGRSIYRIDTETGEVIQLTTGGADFRPVISPDNLEILFARASAGVELVRMPSGGGAVSSITPAFNYDVRSGGWDWSPDGSQIVHTTMMLSGGVVVADLMIGVVPVTTIPPTYPLDLLIIGRVGPGDGSLMDRLPTWRP